MAQFKDDLYLINAIPIWYGFNHSNSSFLTRFNLSEEVFRQEILRRFGAADVHDLEEP